MNFFHLIAPAFTVFLGIGNAYAAPSYPHLLLVEVFTERGVVIHEESITGINEAHKNINVQVYELNGIQRLESLLSNNLPNNPDQAKQITLLRIQKLDAQTMAAIQIAAIGLVKAMQYGIDRYPAIVFDGQAVVYGVTDVQTALAHYRTWRREGKR